MANFIDELTTYLGTQLGGSWTPGTNLFWGRLPASPLPALALFMEPGQPADVVAPVFTPFISLKSRAGGSDPMADAQANWFLAFEILNRTQSLTLTSFEVAFIESLGSGPRSIRTEQQDVILEGNFRVRYKTLS